jgi:anthranilate synthase component II
VRVLVVDNYDSFTWNLVHLVHEALGGEAEVLVRRSRETTVADLVSLAPDRVVLSPGPGDPSAPGGGGSGVSVEAVRALSGRVPILGVCLGHQAIGVAFGARVVRAREVVHGKAREVVTGDDPLFAGLTRPLVAMRYHSLVVEEATLPAALRPIARAADGTLMAMRHASHPTVGLQFHPESVGTPEGAALLRSFLLSP